MKHRKRQDLAGTKSFTSRTRAGGSQIVGCRGSLAYPKLPCTHVGEGHAVALIVTSFLGLDLRKLTLITYAASFASAETLAWLAFWTHFESAAGGLGFRAAVRRVHAQMTFATGSEVVCIQRLVVRTQPKEAHCLDPGRAAAQVIADDREGRDRAKGKASWFESSYESETWPGESDGRLG